MKINGVAHRTIWLDADGVSVRVLDQTRLPHLIETRRLATLADAVDAITSMVVRGAPLIGVTGAYGVALAMREDPGEAGLGRALSALLATRPTAVNLRWTLDLVGRTLADVAPADRFATALSLAGRLAEEDVALNAAIGAHGLEVIEAIAAKKAASTGSGRERLHIATHCNAGWLGTVDWGTALAPIYRAHDAGLDVHVYVDETRPRLQGAALTSFELGQHGVPHTVIPDGASGHVMARRGVDLVIVGCDRVAANGDTANKIGTYMQALAAADTGVPVYVALPSRTVDLSLAHGGLIEIEERSPEEVLTVTGRDAAGGLTRVHVAAPGASALNPAFDVTPARLITGFITEIGVLAPSELARLGALV